MRASIALIILLSLTGWATAQEATTRPNGLDRAGRIAVLRQEVEKACARDVSLVRKGDVKGHSTREFTHIAHDLLVLGQDVGEVPQLITLAFAEQEMDAQSPRYGAVPWQVGVRAASEDENAIEFTCLPLGAILTRYRAQLPDDFVNRLQPHLKAAIAAVERQKVAVSYTNIYLMKISNLLLLGEATGDANAVKQAISNLDQWIDLTRQNGIAEFNSPTYMETQINSASTAYDCTGNADAKKRLRAVLDFLWADAAASYYPPTQQLSGASSRDYDFLYGSGPMDRYLFIEGLRSEAPVGTLLNDMSGPFCDAVEAEYHPDEKTLSLARQLSKSFTCSYGAEAGMQRTLFNTPDFSVGSAGTPDGAQDREIGIRFGTGGGRLPIVSVFLDPFDNPDGSVRIRGKDNHSKPQHMKLNESLVQDRGNILAVYDLGRNVGKDSYTSLGLDLLLPAQSDGLWLDGTKIESIDKTDHPCTDRSVIVLREGKAALAARLFGVGGFAGFQPDYFLKHDIAKGDSFRLVAYAYLGQSKALHDKHVPGAAVLTVETCPTDAAFDDFLKRSGRLAEVQLEASGEIYRVRFDALEAALNTSTGKPAVRTIDGKELTASGPERVGDWNLADLLNWR